MVIATLQLLQMVAGCIINNMAFNHQLLWLEQQLQFQFCVLKKIANFVINIYPMLITWYKSSWWMVCLLSTYLPMSVIPHSAPLFLMNLFSSLGIMYKLLTLPMFQRKASNCTDTSSYYWNNGQICWGPERWHQKEIYRNLQESTLFPKIHSDSKISLWWQINGSSERPPSYPCGNVHYLKELKPMMTSQ